VPIYEPGLEEVINRNVSAKRLRFTGSIQDGVENSQVVFIAVPTPQASDGHVDLSFIEKVARENRRRADDRTASSSTRAPCR
jgi:UDPglucose 6-dehydrogenase